MAGAAGSEDLHEVTQTTTKATGAYSLRRRGSKVKTNRDWYVTSGTARSVTLAQIVNAKVTASAIVVKLSGGHRVTVDGKIDPSHAGQRVLLEQMSHGQWRVLAHVRLNRKSRYTISRRWAHAGVVKLRIEIPADKQNAQSFSPVMAVTLSG